ncbi:MAG: tetratricopeptide repeat protein [Candidatus Zixiibacteriota bacterium]|nr:MAG: tetratricopeptide repeat protein [candidate division Zixibacteria bacterium]
MGKRETYHSNLLPYIPRTIADWYRTSPAGEKHVLSRHEGIIVCIDASGFTVLTRRLSSRGKEGPEILTGVLNRFFEAISGVIFRYGGDVLKFAGDALWAFMPDNLRLADFFGSLLVALDSVNSCDLLAGGAPLKIHVGAETGGFYLASMGDADVRLEAEPVGNILGVVYRACDTAGDNEFAVGPALTGRHEGSHLLTPTDNNFSLVLPNREGSGPFTGEGAPDGESAQPDDLDFLTPYIAQDVLRKIRTSAPSMSVQGEHRQVVVLFANFANNFGRRGDDPGEAITALNHKLKTAFEIIRRYHGSIARIDPYGRGHKLLVLFGAPTKRENDEINALMCATGLINLADDSFRIRIGLAIGTLFCGDVGATSRREYTVMGEGINLAARLMSKTSWKEILVGDTLRSRLPEEVITERVTLSLKGIGEAAVCHRFVGISEKSRRRQAGFTTIGQQTQADGLAAIWKETLGGAKRLVMVTGVTGVGKSTLVDNFVAQVAGDGGFNLECKNSLLFARGWLTRKLLEGLLRNNARHQTESVEDFVAAGVGENWLPLFADVLRSRAAENAWTTGLTPELRTAKTAELFRDLVTAAVGGPQVVVIDDFDLADESFRALVMSLDEIPGDLPLMLVLVAREAAGPLSDGDHVGGFVKLRVEEPSEEEWWRFFDEQFEPGKRERELFERILDASKGNPHFIMQFLDNCRQSSQMVKNAVTGRWELADSGIQVSVPSNLASLHLSLFDGLPEIQRTILKAAAVSVGNFSAKLIGNVVTELPQDEIDDCLHKLTEADLLQHESQKKRFSFTHTSMRQAVYECIPKSQVRSLHLHYAGVAENKGTGDHANLLAYHFYRAGHWRKGFKYSLKAAVQSFDNRALTESAGYFGQCAEIIDSGRDSEVAVADKLEFFNRFSEFLVHEGKYAEAYRAARCWRRAGRADKRTRDCLMAAVTTALLMFRQSRYARSRQVLQAVLKAAAQHGDQKVLARAYSLSVQVDRRTGDSAGAQANGKKAVEIAENIGDVDIIVEARNRLGLAYWSGGKFDKAAESYQKAIAAAEDNRLQLALMQNNLALIEQDRGHFVAAERLFTQALDTFRSVGDRRNEAYSSGNLSNLCRIFGKLTQAKELLRQADLIFERIGDRHSHMYIVGNLGDLDLMLGKMTRAESRFSEVAEFAREVDDRELISECEVRFGELAFFSGDITEAESRYRKAVSIAEEIGAVEYLARGSIGLARLLIGERDHGRAIEMIEKLSAAARAHNLVLAEHEAQFLTGEHHRIQKDNSLAADCYLKALAYGREQNLFELVLKAAARLYETSPTHLEEAATIIRSGRDDFIADNSVTSWEQFVGAPYFSYFSKTLKELLPRKQWTEAETV